MESCRGRLFHAEEAARALREKVEVFEKRQEESMAGVDWLGRWVVEDEGERSMWMRPGKALSQARTLDFIPNIMRSSCRTLSGEGPWSDVVFKKIILASVYKKWGKNEDRETIQEVVIVLQARDDSGLDQGGGGRRNKKRQTQGKLSLQDMLKD